MKVYVAQLWLAGEPEGDMAVFAVREDAVAFLEAEHRKFNNRYGVELEDSIYHIVREREVR